MKRSHTLRSDTELIYKVEKAFETQIANMRVIVLQEAAEWLQNQTQKLTKSFTDELHHVIKQYLDFKAQTFERMKQLPWYK